MSTDGLRRCSHCKVWFRPHPRRAAQQRYCAKPECQAASKRASQQKWCRKNPGYFHGDTHVQRVQAWRREHPGYWKKKGAAAASGPPDALQDLLTTQGFGRQEVQLFRTCLSQEISRPLQDLLMAQRHTLTGLASMISGEPLREDIARVLQACYERGQRIDGMGPWMPGKEPGDERTRTDRAAAAATHPPAVQLGRSPAGP